MTLRPINKRPRFRSFLTYDMEWAKLPINGDRPLQWRHDKARDKWAQEPMGDALIENRKELKLRIVNVYDGEHHTPYFDIQDFLDGVLTTANRGKWFFAHAGGLADVQFVLEGLLERPEYTAKIATSGSSAIIVEIRRDKQTWTFVDSYWMLRDSLANIGKWVGQVKTGPHEGMSQEEITHWYNTVPMHILQPYCENDCEILWHAIDAFETILLEEGGELQRTIAASAMNLFRRRYLSKPLEPSAKANEQLRGSYYASRVEVLRRKGSGYFYDINSSFPYAMTLVQPGELVQSFNHFPTRLSDGEGTPYFVHASITVPEMYLPPIPTRQGGKLYFPTGTWTTWLSWIDLELLLTMGGTINQVFKTMEFEQWWDLAEYATNLYDRRSKSEGFLKLGLKYLLNSLYGKFAEGQEKQVIHLRPTLKILMRLSREHMLMPGIWAEPVIMDIPHEHIPVGAAITAYARRHLYQFMMQALNEYQWVHYCDTDGFATTGGNFVVSNELGGLKLEKIIEVGRYLQPKLYRMDIKRLGAKGLAADTVVKAKGYSLVRKGENTLYRFERISNGHDIEVERMARVREQFSRGIIKPTEVIITKKMRDESPKRCFNEYTGDSRPWTIGEIEVFTRKQEVNANEKAA